MAFLVAQVDHVVIQSGDEGALFEGFRATLGPPVAWRVQAWRPIREGGVTVGNCNLGRNHVLDPASESYRQRQKPVVGAPEAEAPTGKKRRP